MPRKTLALITGLVLVTVVLFVIALRTNNARPVTQVATPTAVPATPTSVANATLTLISQPTLVAPGRQGVVQVQLDAADSAVTAVQLEIAYDPKLIGTVKVTPADPLKSSVVLINKNDAQTGRLTYAFGIQPNQPTIASGVIADITFTARGAKGTQTQLELLPTTLVTAQGVANSVLKTSTGTTIIIDTQVSSPAAGTGM
jgi:hypothetical protein